MKKIGIIYLGNIENIGEELLEENTAYLVSKIDATNEVSTIELSPNKKDLLPNYLLEGILGKILFKISDLLPRSNLKYIVKNIAFKIKLSRYFEDKLKKYTHIIYAVGMLKYTTQDFSYIYTLINQYASKKGISVMMSAMSIEQFSENDWRCLQLQSAVNYKSVKYITTRDTQEELNILIKKYLKPNTTIKTAVVGDVAFWTKDTYNVPNIDLSNNSIIGIGLIRLGVYKDYGLKIDEDSLYAFYKELIQQLEKNNEQWVLFTNGMIEDYNVGLYLLKDLGLPSDKLLPRPKNSEELIAILSKFKCVMGARLHSCITSYALGIPIVGLIWDNKLRAFSNKIQWEEYFIEEDKLNAKYVMQKLIEVQGKQYDNRLLNQSKQSTLKSIKDFLNED